MTAPGSIVAETEVDRLNVNYEEVEDFRIVDTETPPASIGLEKDAADIWLKQYASQLVAV